MTALRDRLSDASAVSIVETRCMANGSGKSATIERPDFRPDRAIESIDAVALAARIFTLAFPGPSENAVCDLAAQRLGIDPSTVRRILRKETKHASFRLVGMAMLYAAQRGVDPLAVAGLREQYLHLFRP